MNAPVATNRWNLALAMKKITSGPSSVASLNIGWGAVLSIIRSITLVASHPSRRGYATPQDEGEANRNALILRRREARSPRNRMIQALQSPAQTSARVTELGR